MKWTIRTELTPDANEPITRDIGTITRSIADLYPEQVGLTVEQGQQLLRRVQMEIITAQARGYELCHRPCVDCGRHRQIKDVRTKCVRTIFGAFRFRGRRYRSCQCRPRPDDPRQDFPLGETCARDTLNAAQPRTYVPLPSICIGLFGATDHAVRRSVNIHWATQGAGR
jgi:hypothetical protein